MQPRKKEKLPSDWRQKEDQFHINQSLQKAQQRISEHRAFPIDIFVSFTATRNGSIYVNSNQISTLISKLSAKDLNDLINEEFLFFVDCDLPNNNYWVICREMCTLQQQKATNSLFEIVKDDFYKVVNSSDELELKKIQNLISRKMDKGGKIDLGYWQAIKTEIKTLMLSLKMKDIEKTLNTQRSKSNSEYTKSEVSDLESVLVKQDSASVKTEEDLPEIPENEIPEVVQDRTDTVDVPFEDVADDIAPRKYEWESVHAPIIPKFKNTVTMGIEWNEYNLAHFNEENPPERVPKGYQFNIFYPNLVNPQSTPSYRIEVDPGRKETVILRFSGGAPYRDICFRIVNRPWGYSHKHGFKCAFQNNVLQLHFPFRKLTYRKS